MNNKVLFVDDEKNVLDGIKRMLHPFRQEWDFYFTESGEDGLNIINQQEINCVVSDMQMPGMNGVDFLNHVYNESPSTARLILSGYADIEPIMQALPISHQFLAKPCKPEQLIRTIKRACDIEGLLKAPEVRGVLNSISTLPTRPEIFNEITQLMASDDYSIEALSKLIEKDAAITTKILQIVNSAYFGLMRSINNVEEAINYLGANTVKSIVLSREVFTKFSKINGDITYPYEQEYAQSSLIANFIKGLFESKSDRDNAFMAGLLQQVGELVLAHYFHDQYQIIQQEVLSSITDRAEFEKKILGVTTRQISSYLLSLWGISYPIVEAIYFSNKPWEYEHECFDLCDALYIANNLVNTSNKTVDETCQNMDMRYLETLGVADKMNEWKTQLTSPEDDK